MKETGIRPRTSGPTHLPDASMRFTTTSSTLRTTKTEGGERERESESKTESGASKSK